MTLEQPEDTAGVGEVLARVLALYDRGKFVAAHDVGRVLGPLARWPGTKGRLLAGRLAGQLGSTRFADSLLLRAYRADPGSLSAALYRTYVLLRRHGTLAALEAIRGAQFSTLADTGLAADWHGLAAHVYGLLHDFDTAESHLAQALELAPDDPYRWVERSSLFEIEDEYTQALSASLRSLEASPTSCSAIQQSARLLTLQDRVEEAIDLLRAKLQEVESPPMAFQLAQIEHDARDYPGALASLALAERLAPFVDKGMKEYLAQRRCDAYFRLDDLERALEQARRCLSPLYRAFVERVESGNNEKRRVQLQVGFVRQHHMTCSPATLTAISLYWSKPAEHLEVAEEICYDGTPHYNERGWAVEHGFAAREFRVTWPSARALIDRGVPFTLTTVYSNHAHLQGVIGYDALRGTLVIRDPTEPGEGEVAEKPFFEWSAANGPRGMLLVPVEDAGRVDDLDLPEAELYDLLHDVQRALVEHRRDDAVALCQRLGDAAPEHRLVLEARRCVANYDASDDEALAAVEALVLLHPDDVPLRLQKSALMRVLRPQAEYVSYLEAQMHAPRSDAMFQLRFAQALQGDAREHPRAVKLLKRALRAMPQSAEAFSTLGDFEWQRAAYPWATELYRLASALQISHEGAAQTYFRAARQVRDHERALDYLRGRVRRLGRRSSAPAITLFQCLEELERTPEALQELDRALAARADDPVLALFAAGALARLNDLERAWPLLAKAEDNSRRIDWLRTAAEVHGCSGDLPKALALSRELVDLAPLNVDSQRAFVQLLDRVESRAAAVAHLRAAVARFPYHRGLNHLLVEWLSEEPVGAKEEAVRHLLSINPDNAWARRELAVVLAQQQRFDQAATELEHARTLVPDSEAFHSCLAYVHILRGERAAARASYRDALAISVDQDFVLQRLLETCVDLEERRAQLAYVHEQLKRQVTRGEGMLTFQQIARGTYEPEELLTILREGLTARPDLWHAWVAVVRQLASINRLDEAQALCDQTAERFPLLPRAHLERAEIRRLRGDRAGEREALREALRLSPGWVMACLRLADSFDADGDRANARSAVEAAIRYAPTDAFLHGYLADLLWRPESRKLSIEHLVRALRFDPGYERAWDTLKARAAEAGEPELAVSLARETTSSRPTDPRGWLALASVSPQLDERLQAAERAVQLVPLSVRAHLRRVQLLTSEGRFDDALAVLRATAWGEALPIELRAARARIFAAQGDLARAIAAIREVLSDDPRHADGWRTLADWYAQLGEHGNYREAAEQLHRLAPNEPIALGYLADANRRLPKGPDVRPWLRRALQLKPDYVWAAAELFDIELRAGNLDEAAAWLVTLKAISDSPSSTGREIELLARRGKKPAALARFRELIRVSGNDDGAIQVAARALLDAGWKFDALEALDLAVRDPAAHPEVSGIWVGLALALQKSGFSFPPEVLDNGAVGRGVAVAFLEHLMKTGESARIGRFVKQRRASLRADAKTWGFVGYALVAARRTREAIEWLSDWRQRDGVESWMLLNAACALRDEARDAEAAEVSRYAIGLRRDNGTPCHQLWLAADAARAGRREEASERFGQVAESACDAYYRCLRHLIDARLRLEDPTLSDQSTRYREARAAVTRALQVFAVFRRSRALSRYADRTLWRLAVVRTGKPARAQLLWVWLRLTM